LSLLAGRTYKYFTGVTLFEFGTGLSLTTFVVKCSEDRSATGASPDWESFQVDFECLVSNTVKMDGDEEVVLAFHSAGEAIRRSVAGRHPVPRKSLIGFERISVVAGGSGTVSFSFGAHSLMLVNANGNRTLYPGKRTLIFSNGAGSGNNISITVAP
jgi:hypothetical protein